MAVAILNTRTAGRSSDPGIDRLSGRIHILPSPLRFTDMKLRNLNGGAQELEAGPLLVLLSDSIPVAYVDLRAEAMAPGVYRTDQRFNKSVTRHINTWLEDKGPHATLPHELIVQAFESISRYSTSPTRWKRRAEDRCSDPNHTRVGT
jgi:hypothetical protein